MLDGQRIVHSDLNAVVVPRGPTADRNDTTGPNRHCKDYSFGNSCGHPFREFTVILHDEVKAVQAFAELEDPENPLHYLKDGMGINYGTGGMGAMVGAGTFVPVGTPACCKIVVISPVTSMPSSVSTRSCMGQGQSGSAGWPWLPSMSTPST